MGMCIDESGHEHGLSELQHAMIRVSPEHVSLMTDFYDPIAFGY
jgi:hypothetical protein